MSAPAFVGRDNELALLERLLALGRAGLVVLNGRRRIGKSRLISHFGSNRRFYVFTGLAPASHIEAQAQRDEFSIYLQKYFSLPPLRADDWSILFGILAEQTRTGEVVILLDEISWMADGDNEFLGKLKTVWDNEFKKNPQLMLVLCGSVSTWIEEHLLGSTGYLGRPSLHIHLQELPLNDCHKFWGVQREQVSAFEKLKFLSITGGVPRYLELMQPKQTAEENIKTLCFDQSGPLFQEFGYIFSDIYGRRSDVYQKIMRCLIHGALTQEVLSRKVAMPQNNRLSEALNELVLGGFVARDYSWQPKTGKISKLSTYRLSDNYARFYLKYIEPNAARVKKGYFESRSLSTLAAWDAMLGLQFENLVLSNHRAVIKCLGVELEDVVFDNPFFQRATLRQPGCQIDYMVQTRQDTVYVCEVKFSRFEVKSSIIEEMEEKLQRLKLPKHLSKRPVLIHVNGVREDVVDSRYFTNIIHFSQLLED